MEFGLLSCSGASEISNNNLTNDYKIEAIALARDPGTCLSSKPLLLAKRTAALAGDKNVVEGSQS